VFNSLKNTFLSKKLHKSGTQKLGLFWGVTTNKLEYSLWKHFKESKANKKVFSLRMNFYHKHKVIRTLKRLIVSKMIKKKNLRKNIFKLFKKNIFHAVIYRRNFSFGL